MLQFLFERSPNILGRLFEVRRILQLPSEFEPRVLVSVVLGGFGGVGLASGPVSELGARNSDPLDVYQPGFHSGLLSANNNEILVKLRLRYYIEIRRKVTRTSPRSLFVGRGCDVICYL